MAAHARTATVLLSLDRTSPVPLHHQLSQQFTAAIARGMLKPGDTLEREDHLAQRLNISRTTLRQAYSDLADKGLIVRVRSVGTMVTEPTDSSKRAFVSGPNPTTSGGRAWMLRLDPDHLDPTVATELGLAELTRLIYVEQLFAIDGRAVSVRRTWLPSSLFNPALQDLTAPPRRVLSEAGHAIASERRTFGYRQADPSERAALGLQASGQVFTVCALSFDHHGAPVARTTTTYRREIDQYDDLLAAG